MSIKDIKNALPKELINILENIYNSGSLDKIYASYYRGRYPSFRVNNLVSNKREVINVLTKNKIKFVNHNILKDSFYTKTVKESSLRDLDIYKTGGIYIQNLSSMLPPLFLDLDENQTILDICAAPGGKSLLMADLTNNKSTILANDINEIRRERMLYNIEKQKADSVIVLGIDGCSIGKRLNNYFHRVLIDAPCSGEGIIRIRKNKKYLGWSEKKVKNYVKLQKKLIDSGYNSLKDKGVMVYSTCTLNPFENEEIVEYALDKYKDLKMEKIEFKITNSMKGLTSYEDKKYSEEMEKTLRIIPNEIMEGFYIAKFIKDNENS